MLPLESCRMVKLLDCKATICYNIIMSDRLYSIGEVADELDRVHIRSEFGFIKGNYLIIYCHKEMIEIGDIGHKSNSMGLNNGL